jgi:hypothetical protein
MKQRYGTMLVTGPEDHGVKNFRNGRAFVSNGNYVCFQLAHKVRRLDSLDLLVSFQCIQYSMHDFANFLV